MGTALRCGRSVSHAGDGEVVFPFVGDLVSWPYPCVLLSRSQLYREPRTAGLAHGSRRNGAGEGGRAETGDTDIDDADDNGTDGHCEGGRGESVGRGEGQLWRGVGGSKGAAAMRIPVMWSTAGAGEVCLPLASCDLRCAPAASVAATPPAPSSLVQVHPTVPHPPPGCAQFKSCLWSAEVSAARRPAGAATAIAAHGRPPVACGGLTAASAPHRPCSTVAAAR